jgi:prolyl-tRNA editing enzyme YbaK/EbsC (Cys-tRNA(Pro) deacylase)
MTELPSSAPSAADQPQLDGSSPTERLLAYLRRTRTEAELVAPGVPMPTVPLASAAIGVDPEQILKTLLFKDRQGVCVLVIACGTARVAADRLAAVADLDRPRLADPATVLQVTGFPAGGTAPVGHATPVRVLIDRRAAALDLAYGGGGAEDILLRIRPSDIVRLTNAEIVDLIVDDQAKKLALTR